MGVLGILLGRNKFWKEGKFRVQASAGERKNRELCERVLQRILIGLDHQLATTFSSSLICPSAKSNCSLACYMLTHVRQSCRRSRYCQEDDSAIRLSAICVQTLETIEILPFSYQHPNKHPA